MLGSFGRRVTLGLWDCLEECAKRVVVQVLQSVTMYKDLLVVGS